MNMRSFIISLSVIVGLSSCGSDTGTTPVPNTQTATNTATTPSINIPANVTVPSETEGLVVFNFVSDITTVGNVNPQYVWDFGDGTSEITQTPFVSHQYSDNEIYKVLVTITDANSIASPKQLTMDVVITSFSEIEELVANIAYTSNLLNINFEALVSGLNGGIASYNWNFGDNTVSSTLANPTHTYMLPGTYGVILTVNDGQNNLVTATRNIIVSATVNNKPTPMMAVTSQNFLAVDVSSYGSVDPDGSDITYTWNFGDGSDPVEAGSEVLWSHTYQAPGTYPITLTVSDGEFETMASETVVVLANPEDGEIYSSLFEKAYFDILSIGCKNCHYDNGPAKTSNFSMGTSGSAITLTSAEAGLLVLVRSPNGFDDLMANPIDGANGHSNSKLTGDDIVTWTDLVESLRTFIAIESNQAPVAVITPAITVSGLTVMVNASGSTDPNGDLLTYTWDFEGNAASGVDATYTFTDSGVKTITLTVSDGKGKSDTVSVMTVSLEKPNSAPIPVFSFTASGLQANFDASASNDEESNPLNYSWDFGDSTAPIVSSTSATATHTYTTEGTYTVTLTVADAFGSAPLEKTITVSLQANNVPVAAFTAIADNLNVTLNAGTSSDADSDMLTYSWMIDSQEVSTSIIYLHPFTTSGVKSIELIVTDSRGDSHSTTQSITLANQAPLANFSFVDNDGVVSFDASGSTDPENDALSYVWDFADSTSGTNQLETHPYSVSGDYLVKLTVNDGFNTASIERSVTVLLPQNSAPRASFTTTQDATNEYLYTFDASTSFDADGDSLTYAWDFGDGVFDTSEVVTHTFAANANYTVSLIVSDGELTSDKREAIVSTVEVLDGDLINGETIYLTQCASCHETDGIDGYGEGKDLTPAIAINRYLDHQADLYLKINTTMPPSNPALCADQCAADVEAFMMTWERSETVAVCTPADEANINYGPRQLRLLTSAEYANTVKTLFGYDVDMSLLPPDDQIHFFSNHAKTALNSSRLDAFESIANKVVEDSVAQSFSNVKGYDEGFTDGIARRAFRRPLDSVESAGYTALEATGYEYALQALLISPNFLFRSELGMTKEQFIDFNENSDPVYKAVGAITSLAGSEMGQYYPNNQKLAGGVVPQNVKGQVFHTFTGSNDMVQIRIKSDGAPTTNITVGETNVFSGVIDWSGFKTIKVGPFSDQSGEKIVSVNNDSNGQGSVIVESFIFSQAEQVIFEVPEIEAGSYALTPYEMATFIAYTYTGNTPDDTLLAAANEGFADEAAIRTQIERLMATDAAKVHFGTFVDQWLLTDGVLSAAKDETMFPGFDDSVREAMAQEAREIFNDVIFNETGFTKLFNSDYTFVNSALADFYGIASSGSSFAKVTDSSRGGLLTTGAFLASQASPTESHLIKRAVRIRERVMCQHLPPFPTDVDLDTIREIQAQKVEDKKAENNGDIRQAHLDYINTDVEACKGCHEYIINPLGVALEDYDAVGLPRTHYLNDAGEQGLTVDFTGFDSSIEAHNAGLYGVNDLYETTDRVELSGVKSVGNVMAAQNVTRECLQEMAFRFIMDTGPDEFDHADKYKIVLAEDELVNYACAMDSMNDAMTVSDNPREAFINLGLSEIVRFRKEYNR